MFDLQEQEESEAVGQQQETPCCLKTNRQMQMTIAEVINISEKQAFQLSVILSSAIAGTCAWALAPNTSMY